MIRYEVKPEEGVVTAEFVSAETGEPISWPDHIQARLMKSVFGKHPWLANCNSLWKELRTNVAGVNTVAMAYCHEADEFDEETGKAIAKARLLQRWDEVTYDSIMRVRGFIRNEMEDVFTTANVALSGMWQPLQKRKNALMEACARSDEDIDAIG